ncbi:iron transporter FeoA [Caloranaerobacter azorensis H53214]|uniref:Ferrous iron transport protein A n=2 Tax=Caloranaerobacter azorensis TaxID=116090 RepID=A0A1M5W2G5_9FIRM|nr:FeoA family protein [Caloranaerobacter azorensis]KGG79498.1 iron transporter FeoA [Caloranaerobacter azorensis H53214]SHH81692.1 ferrous iron transport protein A [Caloranaerobacter azorensis DSM 13643]
MIHEIPLNKLPVGKKARIKVLSKNVLPKRRLMDLGLIPNTIVKTERISPSGNPIAYNIRGAVIALRKEEIENVIVEIID